MALNIKNPEVERLTEEIVALTGETKTEAIRRALEDRLARLAYRAATVDRAKRLMRLLETEVWPRVPETERGKRLSRVAEDALLGYGPEGV